VPNVRRILDRKVKCEANVSMGGLNENPNEKSMMTFPFRMGRHAGSVVHAVCKHFFPNPRCIPDASLHASGDAKFLVINQLSF